MSVRDYDVSFSLEINVEEAYTEIRKLQTLVYRTIGLIRQMGLPEETDEMLAKIQLVIAQINALRIALIALQAALGPMDWALAGVGLAIAAIGAGSAMQEIVGR